MTDKDRGIINAVKDVMQETGHGEVIVKIKDAQVTHIAKTVMIKP